MIFNEELLPRHHLPLKIKFVLESSRVELVYCYFRLLRRNSQSLNHLSLLQISLQTTTRRINIITDRFEVSSFSDQISAVYLSLSPSLWSLFLFLHFSLQFLSLFGSREFEGKHKKKKKKKKVRKPKFSVWLLFRISSDFDLASVGVRFRQTQIYDSIFFICFVSDWISLY